MWLCKRMSSFLGNIHTQLLRALWHADYSHMVEKVKWGGGVCEGVCVESEVIKSTHKMLLTGESW